MNRINNGFKDHLSLGEKINRLSNFKLSLFLLGLILFAVAIDVVINKYVH